MKDSLAITEVRKFDQNGEPIKKAKDTGTEDQIAEYKPYYGLVHSHTWYVYIEECLRKKCLEVIRSDLEVSLEQKEIHQKMIKCKTMETLKGNTFIQGPPHASGCPLLAFLEAHKGANLSFLALTEHSNSFSSERWVGEQEMAGCYTNLSKNKFQALTGFEMTFAGNGIGHLNTFNTSNFTTRYLIAQKYNLESWVKTEILNLGADIQPEDAETVWRILKSTSKNQKYEMYLTKVYNKLRIKPYLSIKEITLNGKTQPQKPVKVDVRNYLYASVMTRLMDITSNKSKQCDIYCMVTNIQVNTISDEQKDITIIKLQRDKKNYGNEIQNQCKKNIETQKNKILESINEMKIPVGNGKVMLVKNLRKSNDIQLKKQVAEKIFQSTKKTLEIYLLGLELYGKDRIYEKEMKLYKKTLIGVQKINKKIKMRETMANLLCLEEYYQWISSQQNIQSVTQFNHPTPSFGDFFSFAFSRQAKNYISLVELCTLEEEDKLAHKARCLQQYDNALKNGWQVAPVFSQDNHRQKWATVNSLRTVVLIPDFPQKASINRNNLYKALCDRHVFATDSKTLLIDFRIRDIEAQKVRDLAIMGDEIKVNLQKKIVFYLKVFDKKYKINSISILGPGMRPEPFKVLPLISRKKQKNEDHLQEIYGQLLRPRNNFYFFVKVDLEDDRIGISAPIWINYRQPRQQEILNQLNS
jgi:hypothetical protein